MRLFFKGENMASQFDASATAFPSRRSILKTVGVGAAGLAGIPFLAACTGGTGPSARGTESSGLTFGSGSSDDVPKRAYEAFTKAFTAKSGVKVTTNVVAHNDFQNNINTYLQGCPDDAFTWFAGYRMHLRRQGSAYSRRRCLGQDRVELLRRPGQGIHRAGRQDYFVPNYNYPWGFFYRKSFWAAKGYEVPRTFDDLIALCDENEGGRHHPDRFRRQGRLAGDGHVRLPQHATQRIPVPHGPLCPRGGLGPEEGQDVFDNWKNCFRSRIRTRWA